MSRVRLIDQLPEGLQFFFANFQEELSTPQFHNFQAWTAGILNGYFEATKISGRFSDRHASALTRFMAESTWNEQSFNAKRISWSVKVLEQRFNKYYPIIIDDTVNKKYGQLLEGAGRYWSNSDKEVVWGQAVVTSHMVLGQHDIPLFVELYEKDKVSKIEIACQHIHNAPKLEGRTGVVVVDSWYSSRSVIEEIVAREFEGVVAFKKNRKVNYMGKKVSVQEIAEGLQDTDFGQVKVEGKVYQCWTHKVKLPGIQLKNSQLMISRQLLNNGSWSDFTFLFVTSASLGSWTILYLYKKRWAIESFFRFAKDALNFDRSRLQSKQAMTRYFVMLFFGYTYLILSRFPLFSFTYPSSSLYDALEKNQESEFEALVDYVHQQSVQGVSVEEIKLKLGFTEKNA